VRETTKATVLIVDDDPAGQRLLSVRLRALGCEVETAGDGQKALASFQRDLPDLMLLDLEMPVMGGLELLRSLRRQRIELPVVVVTAYGSVETAVEAMKEGADDFITKPLDADHLEIVVRKVLEREELRQEKKILADEVGQRYQLIVGESARTKQAVDLARKAAASNATVLLLGESGTGKEIFARNIHNWSERKERPFVAINSVGLSKELLESELFGHERGAFTGAHQLKKGKLELAHRGTVFLDEIGDIGPELQAKLLRFLEEREFERVGGTKSISVDIRIIAATNRDLETLVKDGLFREDLYHRLNVVPITLPPLRERKEDIPVLSHYFLRKYSVETKRHFSKITKEAQEKLLAYVWPGNVRELGNVIERAVVLGSGPNIALEDLPARMAVGKSGAVPGTLSYREGVNAARKELILKALSTTQGNRSAAAKLLGLEAKYLLTLIKSLGIS